MNIAEIRAKILSMLDTDVDWDEFVPLRLYAYAYNIVLLNSTKYKHNKSITASLMILDGYNSEPFHSVYILTNSIHKVISLYVVKELKNSGAVDPIFLSHSYVKESIDSLRSMLGQYTHVVHVHNSVVNLVNAVATDMYMPMSIVASLMLLSTVQSSSVILDTFRKLQLDRYNNLLYQFSINFGSDEIAELFKLSSSDSVALNGSDEHVNFVVKLPKSVADKLLMIRLRTGLKYTDIIAKLYLMSIVFSFKGFAKSKEEKVKSVHVTKMNAYIYNHLKKKCEELGCYLSDFISYLVHNFHMFL